jgi:hypothetical protein
MAKSALTMESQISHDMFSPSQMAQSVGQSVKDKQLEEM